MRDMVQKGRNNSLSGEKNGHAKLTDEQAREIKEMYASGVHQSALAEKFGVNQSRVSEIVNGKTYRGV